MRGARCEVRGARCKGASVICRAASKGDGQTRPIAWKIYRAWGNKTGNSKLSKYDERDLQVGIGYYIFIFRRLFSPDELQ